MERSVKIHLFIKISEFILITWICHFMNHVCILKKNMENNCTFNRILNTRTYRILSESKQDRYSYIVRLKEKTQNNDIRKEEDIFINGKKAPEKRKQLNGSSQKNDRCNKQVMKNKSYIYETKKYSHLEKKIFKELDYIDFLKNNRIINDKTYKEIIRKKFALRIFLPIIILLLLSLSLILDYSGSFGLRKLLFKVLKIASEKWYSKLQDFLKNSPVGAFFKLVQREEFKEIKKAGTSSMKKVKVVYVDWVKGFMGFLIYCIPFLILGVTIISAVFFYHKKVKKYEKIKYRKT
ncbi:fam-l protein [Plasmodium brasilianum]|uniref:Fam-l protein n=1 Tax=Plasmodium brasilianum TaxID=5824 RepID=A0ACB9YFI3_PLABR|nr:fam-l protein [Plasmodium brasilianum]